MQSPPALTQYSKPLSSLTILTALLSLRSANTESSFVDLSGQDVCASLCQRGPNRYYGINTNFHFPMNIITFQMIGDGKLSGVADPQNIAFWETDIQTDGFVITINN